MGLADLEELFSAATIAAERSDASRFILVGFIGKR